jgi:hypothetical protein
MRGYKVLLRQMSGAIKSAESLGMRDVVDDLLRWKTKISRRASEFEKRKLGGRCSCRRRQRSRRDKRE